MHTRIDTERLLPLALIVVAATLLRLTVIAFPSLHFPDENFQFFEQVHRLAFGYGLVPWEFAEGMRSLLLPYLFSLLLLPLSDAGPQVQILVQRLALLAVSMLPVVAAYRWGFTRSRAHAVVLAVAAGTWFEIVYFAARPLGEAIAANLLLAAIALAYRSTHDDDRRGWRMVGVLLGLCLMLRVHLAVGVLLVAVTACGGKFEQRWRPLLAGAVVPLLLFGAADWIAWGSPFHSYVRAVEVNVLQDKASRFGVLPWHWYLRSVWVVWGAATPLLLLLALAQPRRNALWLLAALGILASHSLIPHKEYRFVYPALACLVMAAATTAADWLQRRSGNATSLTRRLALWGVVGAWLLVSLALALSPSFRGNWSARGPLVTMAYGLHERSDLCGLMLHDYYWFDTGGYAHLHRNVPMYSRIQDANARQAAASAFNYALLRRSSMRAFGSPFEPAGCIGNGHGSDVCIMRRPGVCLPDALLRPLQDQPYLGSPSIK